MQKINAAYLECMICHKDITLEWLEDTCVAIREQIELATCCDRKSFVYWGEGKRCRPAVDRRYAE